MGIPRSVSPARFSLLLCCPAPKTKAFAPQFPSVVLLRRRKPLRTQSFRGTIKSLWNLGSEYSLSKLFTFSQIKVLVLDFLSEMMTCWDVIFILLLYIRHTVHCLLEASQDAERERETPGYQGSICSLRRAHNSALLKWRQDRHTVIHGPGWVHRSNVDKEQLLVCEDHSFF